MDILETTFDHVSPQYELLAMQPLRPNRKTRAKPKPEKVALTPEERDVRRKEAARKAWVTRLANGFQPRPKRDPSIPKDPARVAAAHRACDTMRANNAVPNHKKSTN
jgi:hypothetical protein